MIASSHPATKSPLPHGKRDCACAGLEPLEIAARGLLLAPWHVVQAAANEVRLQASGRRLTVGVVHLLVHERAGEIRARLSLRGAPAAASRDAYHAHLKGRHVLNRFTPGSVRQAVEFLAEMGRIDDALETVEPAQALDPLSSAIQAARAFALLMGRRYDEAIRQADLALEMDPGYPMALIRRGLAAVFSGRHAEGVRALERAAEAEARLELLASQSEARTLRCGPVDSRRPRSTCS